MYILTNFKNKKNKKFENKLKNLKKKLDGPARPDLLARSIWDEL